MPAQIIQTNNTPFRNVDLDPITLDIVENALRNARDEMDAVLFRTAMSPGIREQHDAFPMIANQDGKMVVGQFGSFFHGFQAGYDGTIEEGMTLCVESMIGSEGGREGVKLEEQVLITKDGAVPLSSYPFEEDWL